MRTVGPWGLVVIQAAWRICKAHDHGGELPMHFWNPDILRHYSLFGKEHQEDFMRGMDLCEKAGLITRDNRDNRDVMVLHDWGFYQRDHTAMERQRRYRERKKAQLTPRKREPVTGDNVTRDDVTRQDRTGQDKDKKKTVPDACSVTGLTPLKYDYKTHAWNRKSTEEERADWRRAFPGVDLATEFHKATLWLKNNPRKRKKDFAKFLANWFTTAQDRIDKRTR